MRCDRDRTFHSPSKVARAGFLCLGAFREVLVISLAAALVMTVLWQIQSIIKSSIQPEVACNLSSPFPSVLGLDFDRDRQTLLVHTLPGQFEQIHLQSGAISQRHHLQNLISVATSATNSTTIMVAQWSTGVYMLHQIFIIREQELLLSRKLEFPQASSADAHISADGQVALVVGHEGVIFGWDLSSEEPVGWQFQMDSPVLASRLAADGTKVVIVSNDGDPCILDARTGEQRVALPRILEVNRSLAWSHDGRRIAFGDQRGGVHVFDGTTGARVWTHTLDFLFARSLALSANGNLLAVGGFDKQIRIWDLTQSEQPPIMLTGETGVVHNLVFTAEDTRLISGSTDGTIREWSMESRELTRQFR